MQDVKIQYVISSRRRAIYLRNMLEYTNNIYAAYIIFMLLTNYYYKNMKIRNYSLFINHSLFKGIPVKSDWFIMCLKSE